MMFLQDLSLLILGLGDSGLAMARWAARCGAARIVVADTRAAPPGAARLAAELPQAELRCGPLDLALLDGVQLVLKSPGLSPLDAQVSHLLGAARERTIATQGELALFAAALADLQARQDYAPKVIAITGTNGKTTTTSMTAQLVERCGLRVGLAGNIGPTMLDTLAAAIDAEALPDAWVLELSSFQLDGVAGFEPTSAAVLNVTQDHLDWHGSMESYAAAKARIFGRQATMVLNRDDPLVRAMAPAAPPVVAGRSRAAEAAAAAAAGPVHPVVTFGLDAPRAAGDYGLVVENGMAWLVRAQADESAVPRSRRAGASAPAEIVLQRLMPADALRIRGRHNAANALAALALASAAGLPLAPMLHGLREYQGEPHRVEYLSTVAGVDAYDDSKGTNVGATVAALTGLGADRAPARLAVILGGDGKGQDFAPLVEPLLLHARAVALIGRDAPTIEAAAAEALDAAGIARARFASLEEATRWAHAQARTGDALLLSPACASLDMFRNYAHRAEVFASTVSALADELGEMSS